MIVVAAALAGALLGLVGAGAVRLLFDRRQELLRGQAYARVIYAELQSIFNLTEPIRADDEEDRFRLFVQPRTEAWERHQHEIASTVLYAEFLMLTTFYRAVRDLSLAVAAASTQVDEASWQTFDPPEEFTFKRHIVHLLARDLALPSLRWIAEAEKLPLLTWRKVRSPLVGLPDSLCRCGHQFVVHHLATKSRNFLRLRKRSYDAKRVGYECNVEGCSCRRFRYEGDAALVLPFKRLGLGWQAPLFPEPPPADPEPDRSLPASARRGAVVTQAEYDEMVAGAEEPPPSVR